MFVLTRKGIFDKKAGKKIVKLVHEGGRWMVVFEDGSREEVSPHIAGKIKARMRRER